MNSTLNYRDPVGAKIIEVLEQYGPKELKGKYLSGTPFTVAQNQLSFPCAGVSLTTEYTGNETSSHDQSRMLYRVTVFTEMKKEWLQGKNIVGPEMKVHRLLIGRDDKFDLLPDTIEHVLRKFTTLSKDHRLYIDLGNETHAVIKPNIEGRGRGMFLYEGYIEFEVKHNQIKPALQA